MSKCSNNQFKWILWCLDLGLDLTVERTLRASFIYCIDRDMDRSSLIQYNIVHTFFQFATQINFAGYPVYHLIISNSFITKQMNDIRNLTMRDKEEVYP